MTTYNGGKKRLAKTIHKEISKFELKKTGENTMPYFEPFLGMGSVMAEFGKHGCRSLFGCDINQDIVLMWQALQTGWKPPSIVSEEMYDEIKNNTRPCALRGFVGSACSFGGQYFRGYKGRFDSKYDRNYAKMGCESIERVLPYMMDVKILKSSSYDRFKPVGYLIYADPPYKDNKIYTKFFQGFNHEKFWKIMREWSKENIVVISEQQAPSDFVPIWSAEYKVSFTKNTGDFNHKNIVKNMVESLYVHESMFE